MYGYNNYLKLPNYELRHDVCSVDFQFTLTNILAQEK